MSSTNQSVSILIPAYRPDFFRQALESALAQDHPADEIIVSDDCPTGAVQRIAREYLHDHRVSYSRNPTPSGLCGNYLRLARMSTGGWLKFLDDDDELAPDALSGLLDAAARCPKVVLSFSAVRFTEPGRPDRDAHEKLPPCVPGLQYLASHYRKTPITLFTRMLVRREVMAEVDGLNLPSRMISLDEAVGLTAALMGAVAYLDRVTGLHRIHAAGSAQCVDLDVLVNDLRFVTEPCRMARDKDLAAPAAVNRLERAMLRKLARSSLTRLFACGRYGDAARFIAELGAMHPCLALWALLCPRIFTKAVVPLITRPARTWTKEP